MIVSTHIEEQHGKITLPSPGAEFYSPSFRRPPLLQIKINDGAFGKVRIYYK